MGGSAGELPLAQWSDFVYAGTFKVPQGDPILGSNPPGRFDYSQGGIGLSGSTKMYVQGNPDASSVSEACVAEVDIPQLNPSDTFEDLPTASFLQGFLNVFAGVPTGNPQANDKAVYLYEYESTLLGTAVKMYDGDGDNTQFLYRIDDPASLATSTLGGFYGLEGYVKNGYEAAGWISPVPALWRPEVGFDHIMGHSDNWSIGGRASNGPSMFGINLDDVVHAAAEDTQPVQVTRFIDYPHALGMAVFQAAYPDHGHSYTDFNYNCVREDNPYRGGGSVDWPDQGPALGNDVWTEGSTVGFAFIVPGTRTYAAFGHSAGHEFGMGYKIVRDEDFLRTIPATYVSPTRCAIEGDYAAKFADITRVRAMVDSQKAYSYCNGDATYDPSADTTTVTVHDAIFTPALTVIDYAHPTPGPAPYVASDWSHWVWFFDMNEIIAAKNDEIGMGDVAPYAYGPIDTPFELHNGPNDIMEIRSGAIDPATGRLYLSLRQADSGRPLIMAYDLSL